MKYVFGKQIPTSLAELLAPDHNALVLVDFQNDFCKQKITEGETVLYSFLDATIMNAKTLLTEARQRGILIALSNIRRYLTFKMSLRRDCSCSCMHANLPVLLI